MTAIEARGIHFSYGSRTALADVSFTVERGAMHGFLGPNGSGKSTLFKILATILPLQQGDLRLLDLDLRTQVAAVRQRIGVVFQSPALDQKLTVRQNLIYGGHLYGLRGIERREMLRRVIRIQDEAFLDRLIQLGIGPETAMALQLIPLVSVAWADGHMDDREREAILSAAREQGLVTEDMARQVLKDWLEQKPDPQLLSLWKDYVGHIWNHFTDDEKLQMRQNLLTTAEEVANAAGGFLGLSKISAAEKEVIEDLQRALP